MHNKILFSVLTLMMLSYLLSLTTNSSMLLHLLLPPETMAKEAAQEQASDTSNTSNSGNLTFLIFRNSTYGISMLYPSNWHKEENVGGSGSNTNKLIDIVRFSPPFENNNSDKSAENLDVKVDDVSDIQPISLAKYTNDTIEDLGKDFKIISEDRNATAGNNNPAYKVEYTGIEQDVNLNAMIIFTMKDDKAYTISYMAEPTRYSFDLPIIQKIINSIELVK